jgi:hypothetical protein
MAQRVKHSKIKNTGILFELLSRQITVDVMNSEDKSKSVEMLKKFFNENTELGKRRWNHEGHRLAGRSIGRV